MPEPCAFDTRRQAALELLNARVDYERFQAIDYRVQGFKLDRMRELLARLGDPQSELTIIHVAGTKGKGSTSAMLAAMLAAAGHRTGLFTSPHLERIEERIVVDGQICPAAQFVNLVEQVRPAVEAMDRLGEPGDPTSQSPTFFEVLTAMALVHFRACQAAWAVLEVGLGGRLDSTNVCTPAVSIITSISYDHTRQLGGTLELIAGEKAGIIKPGVPVVSGVTQPGPRAVIERVCREQGAPLVQLDVDFSFAYRPPQHLEQAPGCGEVDVVSRGPRCPSAWVNMPLSLPGRHQAANAALALVALDVLQAAQGTVSAEAARRAALAELAWPARVEILSRYPTVVVDAAHNRASVEALLACLDESFAVRRRLLLFATTRDKDLPGMLGCMLGRFDEVALTQYANNPRAVPAAELTQLARELTGRDYPAYANSAAAWSALRAMAGPHDLLCATGSFFIATEVRRLEEPRMP